MTIKLKHSAIKSTSISTSEGPVDIDADGFANVTEEMAVFLTLNFPSEYTEVVKSDAEVKAEQEAAAKAKAEADAKAAQAAQAAKGKK